MSTPQSAVTAEEMHAVILSTFLGWRWIVPNHGADVYLIVPPEKAATYRPEYVREMCPDWDKARYTHRAFPREFDLNLCARAEARIAEMGWKERAYYQRYLEDMYPDDFAGSCAFGLITAPAQARVKALYAVALSIEEPPR